MLSQANIIVCLDEFLIGLDVEILYSYSTVYVLFVYRPNLQHKLHTIILFLKCVFKS